MELTQVLNNEAFIEANTIGTSQGYLQAETIIPAFAKDNESTISHLEFVETVYLAAQKVFSNQSILDPCIKVSHPIKGRIPEAKGKPAKDLKEHEKTLYYERMTFLIELPDIKARLGRDTLSLSLGGVRAYNLENLYNKKSPERFKVFIGFKNWVCTNLCVSTDGFQGDLRVQTTAELLEQCEALFANFRIDQELKRLQELQHYSISPEQFSFIIGRSKQYINLPRDKKRGKPIFPLGDSQLSQLVRDYYRINPSEQESISLWQFYNMMTAANKSSYIDSHLERIVESDAFTKRLADKLSNKLDDWYLPII